MRIVPLIILVIGLGYLCFYKGYQTGWEGYKHSRNMQYALDSAYNYGYADCRTGGFQ